MNATRRKNIVFGIVVGIVMTIAGIGQFLSGFSIYNAAANIYQQQLGAMTSLTGAVLFVGGILAMVLGNMSHVAGQTRKEMIGFRKDLAKMWELDQGTRPVAPIMSDDGKHGRASR